MKSWLGKRLTARFIENPIFVVGAGRSGTSVMLQGLGEHPQIISSDRESPFLPYLGFLVQPFELRENKRYHIDSLNLPLDYAYHMFRRLSFESVFGQDYGVDFVWQTLWQRKTTFRQITRWCAKTFPNEREACSLTRLYPQARFIYIYRNGINVVNSRSRFRGMSRMEFQEHCEIWAKHVAKYDYLLQMEQSITVQQEAVAQDPGGVFRRVISFLGLAADPGPADFAKTTLIHSLDKKTQTNVEVSKALQNRRPSHESWSPEQKEVFKQVCGVPMQKLGYEMPF